MDKSKFSITILLFLYSFGLIACTSAPHIVSPYNSIDWENYGQYKAALHAHTTNSDGRNLFYEVVEAHYDNDFDILAITDHNQVTVSWVSVNNGLSQLRADQIARGDDRGGRGMLRVSYTNEQTLFNEHMNSFFTNWTTSDPNNNITSYVHSPEDILDQVEGLGGIAFYNHPSSRIVGYNNIHRINMYTRHFMDYSSLVGLEIINYRDDGSKGLDRRLWDKLLEQLIPQGRFIWGFSNDDSHENRQIGNSYNIFVMPENNIENFQQAMMSGKFYAVARIARIELGTDFVGSGPVPVIESITINERTGSITIKAQNHERIDWISNGEVITSGDSILLGTHKNKLGTYVRANIIGPGGIVFTQPFGIIW